MLTSTPPLWDHVMIHYIIIIIIIISFMQGSYSYIPETNRVPRDYSVSAILKLLFMMPISLVPALGLLYFYVSTFRSMCALLSLSSHHHHPYYHIYAGFIYNYIPETNHDLTVYFVTTVLYLQFVLHVMLFRPWNMFCTFTLTLSIEYVQCPIWLIFAITQFCAYLVCCSGIVWVILKWFQSTQSLEIHMRYTIFITLQKGFHFLTLCKFSVNAVLV